MATNLAGRGTDILLGGNPKGLVQQLLEHKLLPLLAHGEGRGRGGEQKEPLLLLLVLLLLQLFLLQADARPCGSNWH